MRNNRTRHTSWAVVCMAVLALAAFLFSFWPLAVFAMVVGAFGGAPVLVVVLALVLDLTYGPPPGTLSVVMVPFTVAALLLVLLHQLGRRIVLERGSGNTL